MGLKRLLYSNGKHYWHLNRKKAEKMESLFDLVSLEHGVNPQASPVGMLAVDHITLQVVQK